MPTRFVDRMKELDTLSKLAMDGAGVPLFIYGPEGCGKTRLLRELVSLLTDNNEYITVYVDALETHDLVRGVYGTRDIVKLVLDYANSLKGPLGVILAYAVTRVMSRIEKRFIKNKHVVVVVDDIVKPLGLDKIEVYMKNLLKLVEYDLAEKDPRSILVIATTSEGLSLDKIMLHPTWASTRLLWNLDYKGFSELAELLDPPDSSIINNAWKLTGGNPRALIQLASIYHWNQDLWIEEIRSRIRRIFLENMEVESLRRELRAIADDPDLVFNGRDDNIVRAHKLLQKYNLLIYKAVLTLAGGSLRRDLDLGIGEYYAWQLPVYPKVIKEIIK